MFGGYPRPGDWVTARKTLTVGWTGARIDRGTSGVVVEQVGRHLQVRFDAGLGLTTARVTASEVAVRRRGGGVAAFESRANTLGVVRLALALFLLWPFIWFGVVYVAQNHTTDGLLPALAIGSVDGAANWLLVVVAHPLQSMVYMAFISVLWKFAFRS